MNIIFSHGFGVRYDDRGLFSDIQKALPDADCHMFDYNKVHDDGNMTVRSLPEQTKILESELSKLNGNVTLICHSQGCIVVAMTDLPNVDEVIFLAPPGSLSKSEMLDTFGTRPGVKIDFNDVSEFTRRDGSTTFVPKVYWEGLDAINVSDLYKNLSKNHKLTIFRATEDEILGTTDFSQLSKVHVVDLVANHDFSGPVRDKLVAKLSGIIR